MGLISLLKKTSMGLGSLLLACNTGCNSLGSFQNTDFQKRQNNSATSLEDKVDSEKPRLKKWQYPANIIGGYFIGITFHEGAHAVAGLAGGTKIKEFHILPGVNSIGRHCYGWVDFENWEELSPQERSLMYMAGPVSYIALAETINYNLRKGKISKTHQPFWATTSLLSRWALISNSISAFREEGSDISYFSDVSGIPKEVPAGLVGLYTVLSYKRIKKELNVALGRDLYDNNPKKKGELSLIPSQDGVGVSYTLNF